MTEQSLERHDLDLISLGHPRNLRFWGRCSCGAEIAQAQSRAGLVHGWHNAHRDLIECLDACV